MEQREEGGNNGLVWQLPTRMKYTNIKLTRPIGPDSAKLTKWIVKALNGAQADHRSDHRRWTPRENRSSNGRSTA